MEKLPRAVVGSPSPAGFKALWMRRLGTRGSGGLGDGWTRSWRAFPASVTPIPFPGIKAAAWGTLWLSPVGSSLLLTEQEQLLGLCSLVELLRGGFCRGLSRWLWSKRFRSPRNLPKSPRVSPAVASWQSIPGFTAQGICSWPISRSLAALLCPTRLLQGLCAENTSGLGSFSRKEI